MKKRFFKKFHSDFDCFFNFAENLFDSTYFQSIWTTNSNFWSKLLLDNPSYTTTSSKRKPFHSCKSFKVLLEIEAFAATSDRMNSNLISHESLVMSHTLWGHVETTWTNERGGGCSNDHNTKLQLLSKSVSKRGGGSKLPKILSTWFVHGPYLFLQ